MSSKDIAALVAELKEKFPGIEVDEKLAVTVPAGDLVALMQELKDNPEYDFNYLTNLTAVDYPENFVVVYNLVSFCHGYTLMVKVKADKEDPQVPSLVPLWGGANWQEREVYDLFGIVFAGHPNLKRILLDDGFEGHPLRKDFQWVGGRQ
ncbi:MAG: NADH-quinone oxidoreductase subunit C [Peptococcaceae bacterium]|nr:NADH-quinone oxidoreductase subunit C [Peptococcaceae bacterium]